MVDLNKDVVVEYIFRDMAGGSFWIDIRADGEMQGSLGPFDSEPERQRALDDMVSMLRSTGATDIPLRLQ